MGYKNAICVLPDKLIAVIQEYINGEYLYIPRRAENKKRWGELKSTSDKLNATAEKLGLQNRVKGIVGSMDDLPFQDDEFDLIWSEGAIANIGFEKGLNYWKKFLKKDGYVAVTYESWFTDERPAEIEKWWKDAVPEIGTIAHNISIMQKAGYFPVAAFTLPESCWIDNYFIPQKARQEEFLKKHAGNKTVADMIAFMRREADVYSKYKQYYGYVFYIGKKI